MDFMRKTLNIINVAILFTALICFPVITWITYDVGHHTVERLHQMQEMIIKIDRRSEREALFNSEEYKHYVLITSKEYTSILDDVLELCKNTLKSNQDLTYAERAELMQNINKIEQVVQYREQILLKIDKDYQNHLSDLQPILLKNYITVDEEDINLTNF